MRSDRKRDIIARGDVRSSNAMESQNTKRDMIARTTMHVVMFLSMQAGKIQLSPSKCRHLRATTHVQAQLHLQIKCTDRLQ